MIDAGTHRALLRSVDSTRPETVVRALRDVLRERIGARQVHVLLADYEFNTLRPVLRPDEHVRLEGTAAGDAFASQEVVIRTNRSGDEADVYVPMSVRGDRLGILWLTMPGSVVGEDRAELADLGTLVGYALSVTGQHTDLLRTAARSHRLTLAAELQWQLLPARGCITPEYELAGRFQAAYNVHAESFDWSEDDDRLVVTIMDAAHVMGVAPLLNTLAVTSCRNARRGGLGIVDQAVLADQAVYAHHQGERTVAALMLSIDLQTGRATALKAGSPGLLILRDETLVQVDLRDQDVLGMFEGSDYIAQSFDLVHGDRLLLLSGGIASRLDTAERPLHELIDRKNALNPAEVVGRIAHELTASTQETGHDEATVVCVDWNGHGEPAALTLTEPAVQVPVPRRRLHAVGPDDVGPPISVTH